jgi:RNA polymerase sigma factor (TIGR02999 family)
MLMGHPPSGTEPGAAGASVTELLEAWHEGSETARNQVFELTYAELRTLAAAYLRRERRHGSIQVTALVHEAFLRLVGTQARLTDRRHFYGVAAQAMRRILVDHARRRQAAKRSPEGLRISIEDAGEVQDREGGEALKLDEALSDLERIDPRQARVVELRYFAGLSVEDTATTLDISPATVKREWATARAWIARRVHLHRQAP